MTGIQEVRDSNKVFKDTVFQKACGHLAGKWVSIKELYPMEVGQPLLPSTLSIGQFAQGNHYECFMLSALATLVNFPDVVQNCFVSKKVRQDGRYTFQFFRGRTWVKVEIDDLIAIENSEILYCKSPTKHWWPLLLEKAYAKFYTSYENLEGCSLQEAFLDLTGKPVLSIPIDTKLAKTAGVNIKDGQYWLALGEHLKRGEYVASLLTKDVDLESVGMQSEQFYSILGIFSLTGSSALNDLVIQLYNPFEDDEYSGPLAGADNIWSEKQKERFDVKNPRYIFLPYPFFIKITGAIHLCFMSLVCGDATYFHDEWKGESAGGNPTFITWRKNPAYLVKNSGNTDIKLVVMVKQEDQRRFTGAEETTKYVQCGVVISRAIYPNPMPTVFLTSNNHKLIYKSLFLNSRDVANMVVIPPQSTCYLVPSTMNKGTQAPFELALYRFKSQNYANLSIAKLAVPEMDWEHPAKQDVVLHDRSKDRVDFYVDTPTDIHVLAAQMKSFVNKTGGDAMTADFIGAYLYDDVDRRICAVHAATNFREVSLIHHLPRSGRYALSVTCPRATGDVPVTLTIVGSNPANVRIVDSPNDAGMFEDEDEIDEGVDEQVCIDYTPIEMAANQIEEAPEGKTSYEDRRFYVDNHNTCSELWVHIRELYPEGKTQPLVPKNVSRSQFERGASDFSGCLTAFAAMIERNPDIIRNVFVSRKPRKDGRYTFQFHRYGQWVKVEIDDRIPKSGDTTFFCRSPTRHWWPLLLEKAYAKFYTMYDNLEGITQEEVFHDFTGRPIVLTPTEPSLAKVACCYFGDMEFWRRLKQSLRNSVVTAQAKDKEATAVGLLPHEYYAVLDVVRPSSDSKNDFNSVFLKMYNPLEAGAYKGRMNRKDKAWTAELREKFNPDEENVFYVPASQFSQIFNSIQRGYLNIPVEPGHHLNSQWGETTNGGNPSLISWRENPLYVIQNTVSEPVQIIAMLRQPDLRHRRHTVPDRAIAYPQKGLTLAQASVHSSNIMTYLLTFDNHRLLHPGLFHSTREVTAVLTIPAKSLTYLIGCCMYHDQSKFLLSYWHFHPSDEKKLMIKRYQPDVARHLPAVQALTLANEGRERVDFLVDCPTDIHILVRQEKPFETPNGGDVVAADCIGAYLYNPEDARLKGSLSAINYREISIVYHLPKAGRHALVVTCPRGTGEVRCQVEIVGLEAARVRITDTPEKAPRLMAADLAFLEPAPHGVPLSDLPLDTDPKFQETLHALEDILSNKNPSTSAIEELQRELNERCHEMAAELLGVERPRYLEGMDLAILNPLLNKDADYLAKELARYELIGDPRNDYKVQEQEARLRAAADEVAMTHGHGGGTVSRDYLHREYAEIPVELVPLNDDDKFMRLEQKRAALTTQRGGNEAAIEAKERELHDRAAAVAEKFKQKERAMFLSADQAAPSDALDGDDDFHEAELARLRLRRENAETNAPAIAALEEKMRRRAGEVCMAQKAKERKFLQRSEMGSGAAALQTLLDADPEYLAMEARRRELKKDPKKNAKEIKTLEMKMTERAKQLVDEYVAKERAKFLKSEYDGIPYTNLPLDEDDEYRRLEKLYFAALEDPNADPAELQGLRDALDARAAALVREKNAEDREQYLSGMELGVPLKSIPFDEDSEFRQLMEERAHALADPSRASEVPEIESKLRHRAKELAMMKLAADRGYLHPFPAGIPVELVPLSADAAFSEMEVQRAEMKKAKPAVDPILITLKEEELNERAEVVAQAFKEKERDMFLAKEYDGIPTAALLTDKDSIFHDAEVARLRLRNTDVVSGTNDNSSAIKALEEKMKKRAAELAVNLKDNDRAFLDEAGFVVSQKQLMAMLDENPEYVAMEARRRELMKDPKKNAKEIKTLEMKMTERAKQLADEYVAKERAKFLKSEYDGIPYTNLPLDEDDEYRRLEKLYFVALEDPNVDPAELQGLRDALDARAAALVREKNAEDREQYLSGMELGVPLKSIPFDEDPEFRQLMEERAHALADPSRASEVPEIESKLRHRAQEMAHEQLRSDTAFLSQKPEGIALSCLGLEKDEAFLDMMKQRATLAAQDPDGNRLAIDALEDAMNRRAVEAARALKERHISESVTRTVGPNEVPRIALPLMEDEECARLIAARELALQSGESEEVDQLANALNARAAQLAANKTSSLRAMFVQDPFGIPLSELPLDSDRAYHELEMQALRLLGNPSKNKAALDAVLEEMDKRVRQLAEEKLWEERDKFLTADPEGCPLRSLALSTDPTFLALERQRREALSKGDAALVAQLEAALNDRAAQLAREKNAKERPSYLPAAARGVPIENLPLDGDSEFIHMERVRAMCKVAGDEEGQAKAEDALRARALELAEGVVRGDRAFLHTRPAGVPLRQVPLDEDTVFTQLESRRAALKKDPSATTADIKQLEDELNDRATALASEVKDALRSKLAVAGGHGADGVAVEDLPLDDDKVFVDMEEQYRDAQAVGDKDAMDVLFGKLNSRVSMVAKELHDKERAALEQAPEGIPLSDLPLETDKVFINFEREARALCARPTGITKFAQRLGEIQDELNSRALELAREHRKEYMDAAPEGIPLELLRVYENPVVLAKEAERRSLLHKPAGDRANAAHIALLESDLNAIAKAQAEKLLRGDRDTFMDPQPGGIPLSVLQVDKDDEFARLQLQRAKLLAEEDGANRHAEKIKALEAAMNGRAMELAQRQMNEDLEDLDRTPRGLSMNQLDLYDDPRFRELLKELRELKKDTTENAAEIARLKKKINEYNTEKAAIILANDRMYLDREPEGIPLELLDLDNDPQFAELEAHRAQLKSVDMRRNAAAIRDLEDQLNERACALARDVINRELEGVDKYPLNVPLLDVLKPYKDPAFAAEIERLRELESRGEGHADKQQVAQVKAALNDRAFSLARERLEGDRGYLVENPRGVPLSALPLMTDEEFHTAEVRRAALKADNPHRHNAKMRELEDQLNMRALALAEERQKMDLAGLDTVVEGVSLSVLDPHKDPQFAELVEKRRKIEAAPPVDQQALREVIAAMNTRARELAKKLIENDRDYLDPYPEGVPVDILPLDTDATFVRLEGQRATLKTQDARRNASVIKDLEEQLNLCAHELARAQKEEDLKGVNPQPRGVTLDLLKPHSDPTFMALIKQMRLLKKDRISNKEAMASKLVEMNARADELAKNAMPRDFLDPEPEDIPLDVLELSMDSFFKDMETECAELRLKDLRRNQSKIDNLEMRLNDRAHDRAKNVKTSDLNGVDAAPAGLAKEYLGLHKDDMCCALINELRALKKKGHEENAREINAINTRMNARAHDLASDLVFGDRESYLDPTPLGIPLSDLPLDTDDQFKTLEVERAKIKATKGRSGGGAAIKSVEGMLNDRARDLARMVMEDDLAVFPESIGNVSTTSLRPHDDKVFAEAAARCRSLKKDQKASSEADALVKIMGDRLEEMAREQQDGDMYFLDPEPAGIPIDELDLSGDAAFQEMKQKRKELRDADAVGNRDAIRVLEEDMNAHVRRLAEALVEKDFAGIDPKPLGIPLDLLQPRQDPEMTRLVQDLRRTRRITALKGRAADIEARMDDRAHTLAQQALEHGRDSFLDAEPEGVPLSILVPDEDPHFHELDVQRTILRLMDELDAKVGRNDSVIAKIEPQLNARAHELAKLQLQEDLVGIDEVPLGVPLQVLKPHQDSKMAAMILEVRVLKRSPVRNAAKIRAQQELMNERAHEMARDRLEGDRAFLDRTVLGVPLADLPLDDDEQFHALEVARAAAKSEGDENKLKELEQSLRDRAEVLAREQLTDDLVGLTRAPLGVPLALLDLHEDEQFAAMIPELRRLNHDPVRNAGKVKSLRDRLNERALELAEKFLFADRASYIDAEPEGLPLSLLPLTENRAFKGVEDKKLQLQAVDARGNRDEISALEKELNFMAHEMAQEQLQRDRAYLDRNPEGVPLDVLPLGKDATFRSLEAARAAAKAKRATAQVEDLEDQLNERARQLARAQKREDLKGLEENPSGIPISALQPHEDPYFAELVDELRALKAERFPKADAITDVHERMNSRLHEMAGNLLKHDRGYLNQKPEGIPLHRLPIDQDPEFTRMEAERAALRLDDAHKNQSRITDLEGQINARVFEMARAVKAQDLAGLNQNPRGIPIALLDPHKDQKFSAQVEAKSKLPTSRASSAEEPVVAALNKMLLQMADQVLRNDREYLDLEPEGIPLNRLPLDTDEAFTAMEVERAILKMQDANRNSAIIEDLEDQLNARVHVLALHVLGRDRAYLHPKPEGVPIEILPLDTDNKFHQMEVDRARLCAKDPTGNMGRIRELESRLNDRAVELALKQLDEDLLDLNREPEGYPIQLLRPHNDEKFNAIVPELRAIKASKNQSSAVAINECQEHLNDRLHELAKERIKADRAFLDPNPHGAPVDLLPLGSDEAFRAAEKELRVGKAATKRNESAIADAQNRMNRRAYEVARAFLDSNRAFLDQEPEGVALFELPLDTDKDFNEMEVQRLRLLTNPSRANRKEAVELEGRLNERAHELARQLKNRSRDFLRDHSHGIPKALIALDRDADFCSKEEELRDAVQNGASPAAIQSLRAELQGRADAIAEKQLKGERDMYLEFQPQGVDIADLDLDGDAKFSDLERRRAMLIAEDRIGRKNAIKALEDDLNERLDALAKAFVAADRDYLPEQVEGVPINELPLDIDDRFRRLERQRRKQRRAEDRDGQASTEDELRLVASELATEVVAQDLAPLKDNYRGIPKEDLHLHADAKFRELAAKRRRKRGQGRAAAVEMAAIEDEMDRRACEIADDLVESERAFLDPEPEGMYIIDVPLDEDDTFLRLEAEYRRRSRDARTAKQNSDVLRELAEGMNRRSHALARAEFAMMRDFMDEEPEGVPLPEIGLDEDPEFKEMEIRRYRNIRNAKKNNSSGSDANSNTTTEEAMNARAHVLARELLSNDRGFLDKEPEGVPLEYLPLDTDLEFSDLARERRRRKKGLRKGNTEEHVRSVEDAMNRRVHEMARDFLMNERKFLDKEPEGVLLEDLPLNQDVTFRTLEKKRLALKKSSHHSRSALTDVEADLNGRAHMIALELLKKERAFLEPEPLGVPLEELPLNRDAVLNPIERRRRLLRKDPKRFAEDIRSCEDQMVDRVNQIASTFIDKELGFMDQTPEDVPLRYLPLQTDKDFREMLLQRRQHLHAPAANRAAIKALETRMNDRGHLLAKDLVEKGRSFLDLEPLGVPIADVPLNDDEQFRKLEEQRRALKQDPRNAHAVRVLEDRLNSRAVELAADLLRRERAFMDQTPHGIPLDEIPLNKDTQMRELERVRRRLRKDNGSSDTRGPYAHDIKVIREGMEQRASELALRLLADDRGFLHPEPCGVPLEDLPLDSDHNFHTMELDRRNLKKLGRNLEKIAVLEEELNERAFQLAAEFITKERAYLDQVPGGIPLDRLPLDRDSTFHSMELERRQLLRSGADRLSPQVEDLERRLNKRVHELAQEVRGWQDEDFHAANQHVAESWVRVCDLYPESRSLPLEPQVPSSSDVCSAPEDIGYLAPFIAALARHPVLLQRLLVTKSHPINAPYSFIFFDPSSAPVYVDIDDRVPCDRDEVPKFTQSPNRLWYPLLLEKAYAKFVGGYEQVDNCTPHETLRDLTGRPVTHIPFNRKLADAANIGDYTAVSFWRDVADDMTRGDLILCMSGADAQQMDGIHTQCSYAVLGIIETVEGSHIPANIVIKLHNAYSRDAPYYSGPLSEGDPNWTDDLRRICRYSADRDDILYMPLPTFLRNFSSMQHCHIHCGDRLTASGAWDHITCGGNPRFTSFRNNPIFLVENKGTRPAAILTEIRHTTPSFVDPDGLNHYPQTGAALMHPITACHIPTPLVTNSTHRFLQKGMMLDSREVCSVMEIPANTVCYVVPYTMRSGQTGNFNISIYPGLAKVSLTPLHYAGLSREQTATKVTLSPGKPGRRVDFTVSAATDVHVLLHQDKISDSKSVRKGDAIAEDDVLITAFDDQGIRCGSSGEATNAREHSLIFKTPQPGRYSLLLISPNQPVTGDAPCTLCLFTPKKVTVKFVQPPADAPPLQVGRLPTIPRSAPTSHHEGSRLSHHVATARIGASSFTSYPANGATARGTSLPAIANGKGSIKPSPPKGRGSSTHR